jgi:hypothetical protein
LPSRSFTCDAARVAADDDAVDRALVVAVAALAAARRAAASFAAPLVVGSLTGEMTFVVSRFGMKAWPKSLVLIRGVFVVVVDVVGGVLAVPPEGALGAVGVPPVHCAAIVCPIPDTYSYDMTPPYRIVVT